MQYFKIKENKYIYLKDKEKLEEKLKELNIKKDDIKEIPFEPFFFDGNQYRNMVDSIEELKKLFCAYQESDSAWKKAREGESATQYKVFGLGKDYQSNIKLEVWQPKLSELQRELCYKIYE